jgi:iron complex outermembrane receptor protein
MFNRTRLAAAVSAAVGAGLTAVLPATVLAQTTMDRVEITGSLLRRVEAETALPVTIIKAEDLVKQGVTTAEQAVQRIAANQSNFGVSQAIGATTGGKAEADLRGLSAASGTNANKTLVLLNGRRIANHAFDAAAADLNAIPLSAIDRIEVLRDGASAIYGTDAIGGVINFILRRDYQGIDISAETQRPQKDGGETDRVNLTAGFGSLSKNRFNVLASLDWRKQKVLEAAQRDFSNTGILGTTRADITAGTSGTSFPGDLNGFEPTAPNCAPPGSIPRFSNPDNTGTFETCRYDFTRDIDIIPENEQLTGLLRGSLALGSHIASLEYLRAKNEATSRVAAAPTSHLMPQSSPFFPAGAPLTPGGIPDLNNPGGPNVPGGVANWRQIPAGKRTSGDDTTTQRLMGELQGAFGAWEYRTAIGQSRNKSAASVKRGYVNDDLMAAGVFNGVINPFGAQTAAGQAAIDAAQVVADTLIGENKVRFLDARVTTDLAQLPAGPLAMAVGAEYRKEESFFEATPITAALPSLGIDSESDTKGDRNVKALFAEFSIPVIRNLDLTLAARHDRYSDFGSTTNPKFGVRYQPVQQLLMRGSYNKGFRAPTLYEIYQPFSLTFTTDNYDDPVLCPGGAPVPPASAGVVCGQQVLQRNSGPVGIGRPAATLSPEKSDAYTVGFLVEPMATLSFGLDYWSLKIKEQIAGIPEQAIFGDPAKYSGRFVRCSQLAPGPGPGIDRADIDVCLNFPTFDPIAYIDTPTENLGQLKVRGIDVTFGWRIGATPYGAFAVSIDGTYVDQYKYQRERGGEYFSAAGSYSDNAPVFRWQHVASLNWNAGAFGTVLTNRYKSGYRDQGGDPGVSVRHYSVFDLSVTWTGIRNLTVSAGALNLFDEVPPRSVQATTFQRGYDPRFTDPRGRTFVARIGYKFF